jgi:hypothetical protein
LGLPDKESRTVFSQVLSLMSVNVVKIYAGGFHSWVILDDVNPKKENFRGVHEEEEEDDVSLLNDEDAEKQDILKKH